MSESLAAPRWRIDLVRTALSAGGGVAALAIAGWPSSAAAAAAVAALGAFLGFALALGLEWIARLRGEVVRLQRIEKQAEAERQQADAIKRHFEWQLEVAKREKLISEVHMKVYSGAFLEAGGIERVPFEAIMARIDAGSIAAGLNIPLERPEV
jgi:hypothetical protein